MQNLNLIIQFNICIFNMQQNLQTAHDIFNRNAHSNPFSIKIPSPYASKHNIDIMTHAFILNKIALLPFYQSQRLTQLYKMSLEYLINQEKQKYKNVEFVEGMVSHLQNWQINMSMFGVWPYTRACFYRIEERLKDNVDCLQKVIVKRGILEPNKQQFINKSQNSNIEIKSDDLKMLIKIGNKQASQQARQDSYDLPRDILFIDNDECWNKLQQYYREGHLLKEDIQIYLNQYQRNGLLRYVRLNIKKDNVDLILQSVNLRYRVFRIVTNAQNGTFQKVIKMLQS